MVTIWVALIFALPSLGKGHPCGECGFNLSHSCGTYPGGNTQKPGWEGFPNPFGKSNMGKNTAIVDLLHVPDVPPGECE